MLKWNIFHLTVDSQDGDDDVRIVACEKYYHKTVGAEHVTSSSAAVILSDQNINMISSNIFLYNYLALQTV